MYKGIIMYISQFQALPTLSPLGQPQGIWPKFLSEGKGIWPTDQLIANANWSQLCTILHIFIEEFMFCYKSVDIQWVT